MVKLTYLMSSFCWSVRYWNGNSDWSENYSWCLILYRLTSRSHLRTWGAKSAVLMILNRPIYWYLVTKPAIWLVLDTYDIESSISTCCVEPAIWLVLGVLRWCWCFRAGNGNAVRRGNHEGASTVICSLETQDSPILSLKLKKNAVFKFAFVSQGTNFLCLS
jgi:hypothetical protein